MHTFLRSLVVSVALVGSSSLVACVAQGPDGNPVGSGQAATEVVPVGVDVDHVTHVSLLADRTVVQVELASLADHPNTVVGKLPEGLLPAGYSVKPGGACLPSEIAISDAVAGVSSPMPGHKSLCVSGEGKLELSRICHTFRIVDDKLECIATWATKAKSFTAGSAIGHFHGPEACVDYRPGDRGSSDNLPSSFLTLGSACAIEPMVAKDLAILDGLNAAEPVAAGGVAGK